MFKFRIEKSGYRIKQLAEVTGLSCHVLRKWENRYNFLSPQRAANGYREFDESDLQLLLFIKTQLVTGISIGDIAKKGREFLLMEMNSGPVEVSQVPDTLEPQAIELIQAARRGDSSTVEQMINALIQPLGFEAALTQILFPVLRSIGDLWHHGRISVSGEQLVSQPIHRLLAEYSNLQNEAGNPRAFVACVPNDFHEIGPMLATGLLRKAGWKVTYLGPDTNIEILRLACDRRHAKLVILSCVVEPSEIEMKQLIENIVQELLPVTAVLIGGKGASLYIDWLERKGIRYIGEIERVGEITPQSLGLQRSA